MKCVIVPVTPFQQNCSILVSKAAGTAAIVDPGGDLDKLLARVDELGVRLEKILLTHGHLDHCSAAGVLRERLGIPIEGPHRGDKFWLDGLTEACRSMGFPPAEPFEPDRWLEDGDTVEFGDETLAVLHCPGHTPGHVVFYHSAERLALVGDVLFQGSIGRTDFPGGDHATLIASIRHKLWPLGNEVVFVPGHGPMSTFGEERRTNPFVADMRYG